MRTSSVKKVLVTGSSGFVGRHLIQRLEEKALEHVDCDRTNGTDILDLESVMKLPVVDAVVHLAAKTLVMDSFQNPYEFYHDNILGTLNILEFCRKKGVKKIIFSSSYVYGVPKYLPVDEKHPLDIHNSYGRSKLFSEQLVTAYCEDYDIRGIILRNFNIHGKGQNPRFLIPSLIQQLFSNGKVIKVNDLMPRRDYVYVKDVVDVILRCLEFETSGAEVFNVGIGKSHSVEEVINILFRLSGKKKEIESAGIKRKNEIPDAVADISKLRKVLGWSPRYSFEEGLKELLDDMRSDNV